MKIPPKLISKAKDFIRSFSEFEAERESFFLPDGMPGKVNLVLAPGGDGADIQVQFHLLAASSPNWVGKRCNCYMEFSRSLDVRGSALTWWENLVGSLPAQRASALRQRLKKLDLAQTRFESRLPLHSDFDVSLPRTFREMRKRVEQLDQAVVVLRKQNVELQVKTRMALQDPAVIRAGLATSIPQRFSRDAPPRCMNETCEGEVDVEVFFGCSLIGLGSRFAEADTGRESTEVAKAYLELAEIWLSVFKDPALFGWKYESEDSPIDLTGQLRVTRDLLQKFLEEFVSAVDSRPQNESSRHHGGLSSEGSRSMKTNGADQSGCALSASSPEATLLSGTIDDTEKWSNSEHPVDPDLTEYSVSRERVSGQREGNKLSQAESVGERACGDPVAPEGKRGNPPSSPDGSGGGSRPKTDDRNLPTSAPGAYTGAESPRDGAYSSVTLRVTKGCEVSVSRKEGTEVITAEAPRSTLLRLALLYLRKERPTPLVIYNSEYLDLRKGRRNADRVSSDFRQVRAWGIQYVECHRGTQRMGVPLKQKTLDQLVFEVEVDEKALFAALGF